MLNRGLLLFTQVSQVIKFATPKRVVTRLKAVSPTHFFYSRYPHPKSLPSGKGLTIALTGSNSGVSSET